MNDHYLQSASHLSQPNAGLSLGNNLDARLMSPMNDSDRAFASMNDVRNALSDAQTGLARGRRPSRTSLPKRQSRSRRSSSAVSDQEQNLEVPQIYFGTTLLP